MDDQAAGVPAVAPPPPPVPGAGAGVSAPPSPPGFGFAPVTAPVAPQANDPHGVGLQVGRLGNAARRSGKLAFVVAAALLDESERVDVVVQGRYLGSPGAILVTSTRVLVVNDAQWKPAVRSIPLVAGVTVQGWQDERVATILIRYDEEDTTVDRIPDRLIARELANKIRSRVAESPADGDEEPTPSVEEF